MFLFYLDKHYNIDPYYLHKNQLNYRCTQLCMWLQLESDILDYSHRNSIDHLIKQKN